MRVGVIQLHRDLTINPIEYWHNRPDYVIEVWKSGIKVDLEKAHIESNEEWKLLQEEIRQDMKKALLTHIELHKMEYERL